ncbi:LPS-assembly protein LptD [Parathalassolituus penaei]|uniref:LPS-assembly protein LptD n=1 Tax=Parathalassolituus penaei TaxID=2997323 RepID=A0A9X3EGD9_9GAMM|nr:LPS assembly protein LptD [Parathalassolituus penaei]MCY0963811.1 LPS assembly protein LptD [Parathalassolituus penaei]
MADVSHFDEPPAQPPASTPAPSAMAVSVRYLLVPLLLSPVLGAHGEDNPAASLNWYTRSQLTAAEQAKLPSYCSGDYRRSKIEALDDRRLIAEADESRIDSNGDALLSGNVVMQHGSYQLHSSAAHWRNDLRQAWFDGEVSLYSDDVVVNSDSASFQETGPEPGDGSLTLNSAEYSLPDRHMRGSAESMTTSSDGTVNLEDATMTYCEPGRNDWEMAASNIYLDQEKGVGSAWHTRLRFYNVPILYIPYYRFPIDDQRTTGFLDPVFGINSNGSLSELKLPFYLNLAANADATLTPHYLDDHGWIWENQFRHKSATFGDGELNYNYLNKDSTTEEERWLLNITQRGTFGEHWSHRWVYNKISDDDYLADLNSSVSLDRTTHLPRRGVVAYADDNKTLDFTVESFQTIDPDIDLSNRPYRRLPDLRLGYQLRDSEWQTTHVVEGTRFTRDHEAIIDGSAQTLTGFDALDGDRLVADNGVFYRLENSWGYLMPGAEYRYRQYDLYSDEDLTDTRSGEVHLGAARYSLDSGITLERTTALGSLPLRQTLEPRLYWVRSPAQGDQEYIPTFDTRRTTVSYDSLFRGDRFTGQDRLADLNQLSMGVTTRLLTEEGDEWLKFSMGRVTYFDSRKVQLTSDDLPENLGTSSILSETEWHPWRSWALYQMTEWDSYQNYARQNRYGVTYRNEHNQMLNLASNRVQEENADYDGIDTTLYQADAGAFWALNDSWALTGRVLKDLKSYDTDERRPVSPWLETLAGVEYQNCCWRVQMLYRNMSPTADDDAEFSTYQRHSLMFSFQLKGLGTFGSSTDSTISQSIKGYTKRSYHDY